MRTLYEASSTVEAHMIVDLLKREGLTARIHGEHLQGAIGGLPAAGLVRVVVEDADYEQARAIVVLWDADQPKEAPQKSPSRPPKFLYGFLVGLTLGVAASCAYFRTPVTLDGIDYNRDGILDEKWTYAPSGRILKVEADRNRDGKVDHITHFDGQGLIESGESDDNFDGVFETRMRFRAGNVQLMEVDTDGDGYHDLIWHFENGMLSSAEYIKPSTGLPLRIEYFKLGKRTMAEVDTDEDGVLDTRYRYDKLNDVISTEAVPR